jgi:gamma-glutamyltranspeptidase
LLRLRDTGAIAERMVAESPGLLVPIPRVLPDAVMPRSWARRFVVLRVGAFGLAALGFMAVAVKSAPQAEPSDPRGRPSAATTGAVSGARDPAWSPASTHIALSIYDQIWVMTREGQAARSLTDWNDPRHVVERDPVWSPDGRHVAFAADRGDGFDVFVVAALGGAPQRVTFLPGDERWPSWTPAGQLVFAHRHDRQWDLFRVTLPPPDAVAASPERLTRSTFDETEPRVSPDGRLVLFASTRESDDGHADLWVMPLGPGEAAADEARVATLTRVVQARGPEWSPSWSAAGDRFAFAAVRDGVASIWVAGMSGLSSGDTPPPRPVATPLLVSRSGGQVAWSPDGRRLLVTDVPDHELAYNGEPLRDHRERPPLFALGRGFAARVLPAPDLPDEGEVFVSARLPNLSSRLLPTFDRIWSLLDQLYYAHGASAVRWEVLRDIYRPQAAAARDERALELVVDAMLAEQPLVRPIVRSPRAVVVSGHRLASEAGARVIERGGNVVDAAIAVSFALGVVEPDASGIGGDGMALVLLAGMRDPVVVDFKDQVPGLATLDNSAIFRDGRLVGDGPAAANIPGMVAGLGSLHERFGSKRIPWSELVEPAIRYAEGGFVLDETLPTTIAEAQSVLSRYEAAKQIYLPGGRVPRPGERFVNRDYGSTLRAIAERGAREFYEGEIARRIARDLSEHGGIIRYEDLAQYRALERQPLTGRFRDHIVFSTPPPVASGAALIEALQIVDHYGLSTATGYARDADYLHVLIEAWKARHPLTRVADPALWPVDITPHLDRSHAGELFRQVDPQRAGRLRDPERDSDDASFPAGDEDRRSGRGTTAFVVADIDGNAVVATQTLSTWGGSFYVSKGLGFLYNNHLRATRAVPGTFGHLRPLARSSSTNASTLVIQDVDGVRRLRLAVGAAGNTWILPSVYAIVSGVLDGGLGAQAAVEAPRFAVTRDPRDGTGTSARVQIEDRFPRPLLEDLARRGHVFQKIGHKGELRYGYASAAVLDGERRIVEGGADPRRSHVAIAVR